MKNWYNLVAGILCGIGAIAFLDGEQDWISLLNAFFAGANLIIFIFANISK